MKKLILVLILCASSGLIAMEATVASLQKQLEEVIDEQESLIMRIHRVQSAYDTAKKERQGLKQKEIEENKKPVWQRNLGSIHRALSALEDEKDTLSDTEKELTRKRADLRTREVTLREKLKELKQQK